MIDIQRNVPERVRTRASRLSRRPRPKRRWENRTAAVSSGCTRSMKGWPTSSSGRHPRFTATDGDSHSSTPSAVQRNTTSAEFSTSMRRRASLSSRAWRAWTCSVTSTTWLMK